MIVPENLEVDGTTRKNNQYFVVGQPLDWRDGGDLYLIISRQVNDDFTLLIKVVEQDPGLGVKNFHPSINDDSEATGGDKEENNNQNALKT